MKKKPTNKKQTGYTTADIKALEKAIIQCVAELGSFKDQVKEWMKQHEEKTEPFRDIITQLQEKLNVFDKEQFRMRLNGMNKVDKTTCEEMVKRHDSVNKNIKDIQKICILNIIVSFILIIFIFLLHVM